jgi:hypothetical protein
MIYSQFKFYTSIDLGAPVLSAGTGSIIDVLDACLINGYGDKTPAGWLRPIPSMTASYRACYQQPSGSGFILFVNDSGPYLVGALSGPRNAWVAGYETLLGLTASAGLGASYMAEGTGQFPTPRQPQVIDPGRISGSLLWAKSYTMDLTVRHWMMFVDAYTMYFFVANGLGSFNDTKTYSLYGFGDFYSYTRRPDPWNCFSMGRLGDAAQSGVSYDPNEYLQTFNNPNYPFFIARSFTGFTSSVHGQRLGDCSKLAVIADTNPLMNGGLYGTSEPINGAYVTPIEIGEGNITIRGKFRGLYTISHHYQTLSDGMIFSGSNHHQGKIFRVIKQGQSLGTWVIEVSNTVETNDT